MRLFIRLPLLLMSIAVTQFPGAVRATMLLPGGDTLLDGGFDDLGYGSTGNAFVTPLLHVGELATTEPPEQIDAVTNLTHDYVLAGLGTSVATITYTIRNDGPTPFNDLRFMVDVQADGSSSFLDLVTIVFGAAGGGEPAGFQVGDFSSSPLASSLVTNNGVDGSDACGMAACDADLALQWDLPTLAPGLSWNIVVGLSDDGTALSANFLQATSADTSGTVLTFSGVASVVPEPTTAILLGMGLVSLRARARLERARQMRRA